MFYCHPKQCHFILCAAKSSAMQNTVFFCDIFPIHISSNPPCWCPDLQIQLPPGHRCASVSKALSTQRVQSGAHYLPSPNLPTITSQLLLILSKFSASMQILKTWRQEPIGLSGKHLWRAVISLLEPWQRETACNHPFVSIHTNSKRRFLLTVPQQAYIHSTLSKLAYFWKWSLVSMTSCELSPMSKEVSWFPFFKLHFYFTLRSECHTLALWLSLHCLTAAVRKFGPR